MARSIIAKSKIARKFGEPIFGFDKVLEKKNYPPGQHGISKRRGRKSEYATQLLEKQKAKYTYGLLEKQFRRFFSLAVSKEGVTGELLLQLLESRIDNLVFRLGFAPTRSAARQLVLHKHICLNGKVHNIPSTILVPGDVISVREKSKSLLVVKESLLNSSAKKHKWLELDSTEKSGKYIQRPTREEIPEKIKENLIVELYSK